jgi:hypothetical protein
MKTSNQFSLNLQDAAKGLIIAVGSAVITIIENTLSSGSLTFNWKQIGLSALAAAVAYLGKNFFTSSKIVNPYEPK